MECMCLSKKVLKRAFVDMGLVGLGCDTVWDDDVCWYGGH